MPDDLRRGLVAAGLILAMGILAGVRPQPLREAPPPIPAVRCEAWMADAIPRIGVKKREPVAAAIRHGDIPPAAREWFTK